MSVVVVQEIPRTTSETPNQSLRRVRRRLKDLDALPVGPFHVSATIHSLAGTSSPASVCLFKDQDFEDGRVAVIRQKDLLYVLPVSPDSFRMSDALWKISCRGMEYSLPRLSVRLGSICLDGELKMASIDVECSVSSVPIICSRRIHHVLDLLVGPGASSIPSGTNKDSMMNYNRLDTYRQYAKVFVEILILENHYVD